MNDRPLVIYHGNCADGFAAAWVFENYFPEKCDFHPGVYQEDIFALQEISNREVFLVDFSYRREVVERMNFLGAEVTLIDHHKTAIDDLQPLMDDGSILQFCDLKRSGAMLAWDYVNAKFNTAHKPPKLIEHIQDRDLWQFKLPNTKEIQATVFSFPYEFEVWDNLMKADIHMLAVDGHGILRKHMKDIEELVKVCKRRMLIAGWNVPAACLPYTMASDAGEMMAVREPFAATYYDRADGMRVFSLRSEEGGKDVASIAALYGGGGHEHASGFRVPFSRIDEFEIE